MAGPVSAFMKTGSNLKTMILFFPLLEGYKYGWHDIMAG